jgi:uncharacterized protein YjbI with pentapeptide repeats
LSIWLITILGGAFAALCIVLGVYFIRPGWNSGGSRSDLGVALMTGAVISVAVLGLQIANELRVEDVEKRRQLLASIGSSMRLDGIDLSGEDLEGVHLGSKIFDDARFVGTDLQGANLSRSRFERATFEGADLREANMRATDFQGAHFQDANLSGATLHSACLREADLRGADVRAKELTATDVWLAEYDSETEWPDRTPWRRPSICDAERCVLDDAAEYIYRGSCDG